MFAVPGNAEPVMEPQTNSNRADRTVQDGRVNTDRAFADFRSLEAIMCSTGIERAEPTVDNLRKLLRLYLQSRSVGRTALARALYCDPVLQLNVCNAGMCC